jgi:hypothetical protein
MCSNLSINLTAAEINQITGNCATKIVFEWKGSKEDEEALKQLIQKFSGDRINPSPKAKMYTL